MLIVVVNNVPVSVTAGDTCRCSSDLQLYYVLQSHGVIVDDGPTPGRSALRRVGADVTSGPPSLGPRPSMCLVQS
jgi:hypothetical protein